MLYLLGWDYGLSIASSPSPSSIFINQQKRLDTWHLKTHTDRSSLLAPRTSLLAPLLGVLFWLLTFKLQLLERLLQSWDLLTFLQQAFILSLLHSAVLADAFFLPKTVLILMSSKKCNLNELDHSLPPSVRQQSWVCEIVDLGRYPERLSRIKPWMMKFASH